MHLVTTLLTAVTVLGSLIGAAPVSTERSSYDPRRAVDLGLDIPKPSELPRLFDMKGIGAMGRSQLQRKGENLARNMRRRYRSHYPSGDLPPDVKQQANQEFRERFMQEIENTRLEHEQQLTTQRAREQAVNEKLSDIELQEKLQAKRRSLETVEKKLCHRMAGPKHLIYCEDAVPRYREQIEALEGLLARRKKEKGEREGWSDGADETTAGVGGADDGLGEKRPGGAEIEPLATLRHLRGSASLAGQPSKLVLDGVRGLVGGGLVAGGIEGIRRLIPGFGGFGVPENVLSF